MEWRRSKNTESESPGYEKKTRLLRSRFLFNWARIYVYTHLQIQSDTDPLQ